MTPNQANTTLVHQPSARLQFGHARADITPPANIYHPMWGAARHHRATGIHRPLYGDIMVFSTVEGDTWAQVQLDMVGLGNEHHTQFQTTIAQAIGIAVENVILAYSHTHAGGFFLLNRVDFPGGELILPYLDEINAKLSHTAAHAATALAPVTATFRYGRSDMAANRDFWDDENNLYACGYNPNAPADDTVLVARFTQDSGKSDSGKPDSDKLVATLVNYACHPTSLAWENTLISPDYVGALREEVESQTGAPCVFTLGACGDLGPRRNHQGDTAIADANGRQVGFAALAALEGMDPPGMAFAYQGPVISGATLGTWQPVPLPTDAAQATTVARGGLQQVDLPQKPVPDAATLEAQMQDFLQKQADADAAGDPVAARNFGAFAERARRWLGRLPTLSTDPTYRYSFSVRRMGDSVWVALQGEPYNWLQRELRRRFPSAAIVCTVMAGQMGVAYLLPKDRYGVGLYQEEPSSLDRGCLEQLYAAVVEQIEALGVPATDQ
ncbi:MAG: hypothetical protein WDZ49_02930 [Litorilinea sp.]